MFKNVAADTNIIFYLMIAVGVIGVLSKIVNQLTLNRMVKAAGDMSKSTHQFIKHVRAEYEHACMIHGTVDNALAFIRKYLYEYRGFLFRIHTWKQLEIQTIWFSGILAALGASGHYMAHGFCEGMFQYIAIGAAEMLTLFVISQLSDESYKVKGTEIYMVDYLENVCSHHYKKIRQTEKETLDIINTESARISKAAARKKEQETPHSMQEEPTHIEWKADTGQTMQCPTNVKAEEDEFSARKEEAIRLILAEFLA